jgi:hypothetical protein
MDWASQRGEIFLVEGFPLTWRTRPPRISHYATGTDISLPENWIMTGGMSSGVEFARCFPVIENRDHEFSFAQHQQGLTWEKQWWWFSGEVDGDFLRNVCRAWSCEIEELLAPIADRHWSDFAYVDDQSTEPIFGYRLQRPN